MMSTVVFVCGLLFGNFKASLPPLGVRTKIVTPGKMEGTIHPTAQPSFYTCLDDNIRMHYFIHHEHVLFRCIWAVEMSLPEKVYVIRGLREWLHNASSSNITLSMSLKNDEDSLAYHMSCLD